MGFSICYITTKATPDQVIEHLKLSVTRETQEMPDYDWWVAKPTTGYTVFWSEDFEFCMKSQGKIEALSQCAEVYVGEVHEGVMWSSCAFWHRGEQIWSVQHTGDGSEAEDPSHFNLHTSGTPPEIFEGIKAKYFEAQKTDGEDVDHVFEVPIALTEQISGFRYDKITTSDRFLIVTPPLGKQRGFIAKLFGKK